MGFWSRLRETEVERTLRARAPRPSDELVRGISRMVATPRRRRGGLPKLALVGAVTTLLAASLGVAGALGYARESVHTFAHNVSHFVEPKENDHHGSQPPAPVFVFGSKHEDGHGNDGHGNGKGGDGNGNGGNGNGGGQQGGDGKGGKGGDGQGHEGGGDGDHNPYGHQYGHRVPLCFRGYIIKVPLADIAYWIAQGAGPPWQCSNGHHRH